MKKVSYFLLAAVLVLTVTSCFDKGIKPANVAITGPLGQYFQVVDKQCKIRDGKVSVEVKRIADGLPAPWISDFGTKVGTEAGEIEPVLGIEFFDKNDLSDGCAYSLDHDNGLYNVNVKELQKMVNLPVGGTCSVTFEADSDDATTFLVFSTFKYNPKFPFHTRLSGAIRTNSGKSYPIVMDLNFKDPEDGAFLADVSGYYFYKSQGEGNVIRVVGVLSYSNYLTILSEDYSETFEGPSDYFTYSGTWTMSNNGRTKALTFDLAAEGVSSQQIDPDILYEEDEPEEEDMDILEEGKKLLQKGEKLLKKSEEYEKLLDDLFN